MLQFKRQSEIIQCIIGMLSYKPIQRREMLLRFMSRRLWFIKTKQNNLTITTYYKESFVARFVSSSTIEMESTTNASMLAKMLKWDYVFNFLASLKPEQDEVRSRVLGKRTSFMLK